jgi:hypothetical protein
MLQIQFLIKNCRELHFIDDMLLVEPTPSPIVAIQYFLHYLLCLSEPP